MAQTKIKGSMIEGGATLGPSVIEANTSGDALRITQTGSGNALVVEDATSPDTSAFKVDGTGIVSTGFSAAISVPNYAGVSSSQRLQVNGGTNSALFAQYVTASSGPNVVFAKARGSEASPSIVSSGDLLGIISAVGYDGAAHVNAASISAAVDGTPGTNDMPGRLVFATTADGASSPTERMRITSAGYVGIGDTSPSARLEVTGVSLATPVAAVHNTAWDGSATGTQHLTVNVNGAAFTIANPSSSTSGAIYLVYVVYTTTHSIAWGANFKGVSGVTPTATAGAKDIFVFRSTGTNLELVGYTLNAGA